MTEEENMPEINEEVADVAAALEALDAIAAGEPVLPWEDVKARLDLDDDAAVGPYASGCSLPCCVR